MSSIRYVCLSDLHLGADNSVLTCLKPDGRRRDFLRPSPMLVQLVKCMRTVIDQDNPARRPTLVLNGDILELALATTNEAAMTFERFMDLIFPKAGDPLFDNKIFFLAGNHDHHLWETARETQYLKHIPTLKQRLPVPWHGTNMFVEHDTHPVPSSFLTTLIQRYPQRGGVNVACAYPNFAVHAERGEKCVVFHHGHFVESMYQLMSTLKTAILPTRRRPTNVFDLEAENFAWIDFFWSALGRSGEVGRDVDMIYSKMQNPAAFKKLLRRAAKRKLAGFSTRLKSKIDLSSILRLPKWATGPVEPKIDRLIDWAVDRLAEELVDAAVDRVIGRERRKPTDVLSSDAEAGLHTYVEQFLRPELLRECEKICKKQRVPRDLTFVFGHTHKPFERRMSFKGLGNRRRVRVYNSGGWVVDSDRAEPLHGGAVILFDEELNAASLRMFNQEKTTEEYRVRVSGDDESNAAVNSLQRRLRRLVKDGSEQPWRSFSRTAAQEVRKRWTLMKRKIGGP